jgi:hypothetical protein
MGFPGILRVVRSARLALDAEATGKTLNAPFVHVWGVRANRLARFGMHTGTWLGRLAQAA